MMHTQTACTEKRMATATVIIISLSSESYLDFQSLWFLRLRLGQTDGEMNVVTLLLHYKQITKPQR